MKIKEKSNCNEMEQGRELQEDRSGLSKHDQLRWIDIRDELA